MCKFVIGSQTSYIILQFSKLQFEEYQTILYTRLTLVLIDLCIRKPKWRLKYNSLYASNFHLMYSIINSFSLQIKILLFSSDFQSLAARLEHQIQGSVHLFASLQLECSPQDD